MLERNTTVRSIIGKHVSSETNLNVQGIHIIGAAHLPKNIDTFFPNLIGLSAEQHLKEITQSDLKSFPKLKHLWLGRNQLEVIQKDLFEFNPELMYICLRQNFIKEIYANVFDSLKSLRILELDRNDCINDNAVGKYGVLRLINQTKERCAVIGSHTTTTIVIDQKRIPNKELIFWSTALLLVVVMVGITFMLMKTCRNSELHFVSFREV